MNLGITLFLFLCCISFFYGYLTYQPQLADAPLYLWLFIPDCPLYVGLMLVVVMLNVRNETLRFVTGAGLAKYGMWTLMIFLLYSGHYFSPLRIFHTTVLFAGHILMVAGAFVILPGKPGARTVLPALAWFLFNDFMDYGVGALPRFPTEHLDIVVLASILLSILSVFGLVLLNSLRNSRFGLWVRRSLVYQNENKI